MSNLRFFLFSFSGIVFTSTTTTTTTTSTSNQKFAAAAKFIAHVKSSHRKVSDSSASNNHNNNHQNNHHLHNFGNNLQLPHFPTEVSRRQSSITSVRSTTTFQFNRSLLSKLISFFTLFANAFVLLTFLVPIFLGPMEVRREAQTFFKMQDNVREALSNIVFRSKNLTAPGLEFHLHEFFGKDVDEEYWEEFMHLKPILRNLTKSAVYIFMIDALCQFLFNLILGGSLVSRISRLPGLREVGDRDRKLAYQLLAGTFLIIGGFSLAGLLIFNQKQLKTLVELLVAQFKSSGVFEGEKKVVVDEEEVDKLVQTALIVCVHQYHYFILAMVSVLFVYTMITGRRILDSMRAEVTGGEEFDLTLSEDSTFNSFKKPPPTLTETHLHDLKRRLTILAAHFSGIVSALALPITTVMLSNALLIIGSFCFLLIHKLKEDDYFVVFIFNLGAFAFCRLVLLCAWGNALTTGHRELVRAIYEAMADGGGGDGEGDEGDGGSSAAWTLPKWMAFLEIKRLATRFEVNIGGVYSVKQSAILTVLGKFWEAVFGNSVNSNSSFFQTDSLLSELHCGKWKMVMMMITLF